MSRKAIWLLAVVALIGCGKSTQPASVGSIEFHGKSYPLIGKRMLASDIGVLGNPGYMHSNQNGDGLFLCRVDLNQNHSEQLKAECVLSDGRWVRHGFTEVWDGDQIRERDKFRFGKSIPEEYRKWRSDGTEIN